MRGPTTSEKQTNKQVTYNKHVEPANCRPQQEQKMRANNERNKGSKDKRMSMPNERKVHETESQSVSIEDE
jgi:hypothetical protein